MDAAGRDATTAPDAGRAAGDAGAAGTDAALDGGTTDDIAPTTCSDAESEGGHWGCEHWAADLDNVWSDRGDTAAEEPAVLLVTNPQAVEVTVDVTRSAGGTVTVVTSVAVPARDFVRIELPQREVDGRVADDVDAPGSLLSSLGYRVEASAPVAVHMINASVASAGSSDGSLLLPATDLGNDYVVPGWPAAHPVETGDDLVGVLSPIPPRARRRGEAVVRRPPRRRPARTARRTGRRRKRQRAGT